MRYALALFAAAVLAPAVPAADPPVTFQTQPVNRVLDDLRAAADLIGGERAVKSLNDGIKASFDEKGFDGLDLNRPLAGYVVLAPKLADTVAVVAFPVTAEKAFLGLADRVLGAEPKDVGNGLYALPALEPGHKARLRFSEQYAYIAYGVSPEAALDAKALVPAHKLVDPADQSLVAVKLHFDRVPAEVKKALPGYLADVKKALTAEPKGGPLGFGAQERAIVQPLAEQFEKLLVRYALLLGGGDTAAVRLGLDVPTGSLSLEATLSGTPDTALAKAIAAQKPTGNKFAALLTPDTAAGFKTRLPLFTEELRTGAVKALEEGQKQAAQGGEKEFTDALFAGLIRTAKTGEADVVGAFRGPDKNGDFTAVVAVAFEDPSTVAKEFRKLMEKEPEEVQGRFKWGAAKAGGVDVHTYFYKRAAGERFWIDISKPFGGEKAGIAFAFAPHGVFVALGPDPVPVIQEAVAVKPAEAPVLDLVVNPARMRKFVERAGGPGEGVEHALGKEDKLLSALSLAVTGGKELKVRAALNLRLLPRALVGELEPKSAEGIPLKK